LVHPASLSSGFRHASDIFAATGRFRLSALFGPQHGIRGETQDNMIEWEGFRDRRKRLPVYSLYGKTRKPTGKMLREIDVLAIDLQDIGSRYYTFIWTMALCMEACEKHGKTVVVLDRPNPIGGQLLEGPVLRREYSSFVGLHPLPVRHGMTMGEIAFYLRDSFYGSLDLQVIRMKNWSRELWFEETCLPWVLPSPNMPAVETAMVYPGMCLLEGTNVSEGRGTTKPFEIFGAPFVNPADFVNLLASYNLPGLIFRPLSFVPTFQKHAGKVCGGAQIHVTDRQRFKPFKTAVAVIKAFHELYPRGFAWKNPPYEYEDVLLPIDILAGTDLLRKDIEKGASLKSMEAWWKSELEQFRKNVRPSYLLYR